MRSRKHKNGGAVGHCTTAGEAMLSVPSALPTETEGLERRADVAESPLPSGSDGEGHTTIADEASRWRPAPSQQFQDDGQGNQADKASSGLPSSESGETGHLKTANVATADVPVSPLIDQLAELQVRRKFYIGAINKQTNAVKALVRRALGWSPDDKGKEAINKRAAAIVAAALSGKEVKPEDAEVFQALIGTLAVVSQAIEPMQRARDDVERDMKRAAKKLPVYTWAKDVKGLGELGLAVLVGEARDIGAYPEKGHLWKRLGLAPYGDKAMSTWRMKGGLSADEWIAAGYSPRRRAEIYSVIGDPLFRAQSVAKGPYRARYDARRARTAETHPDWTKAHSHNDALRVMTKHLVRDLWVAWRRAVGEAPSEAIPVLPAAISNQPQATA